MTGKNYHLLVTITFLIPSGVVYAQSAGGTPLFSYSRLWPIHMVLMSISFAHLLTGMVVSAFMKKKKWWLAVHRRLQWIGGGSGIAGLATAVYMVSVSSGSHFRLLHSALGLVGIVMIASGLIVGLSIFRVRNEKKKTFRLVHRWLGRATLALMAVIIASGLTIAGII